MSQNKPSEFLGENKQPHRGTLVLVLGILSIIFNGCLIPGLLAWILGRSDLKRMKAGTMDPSGEGMTKAGYVCGIIGTCLWIIGTIVAVVLYSVALYMVTVY